ncbi:MAG: exodeoxyribonuclease VII small subunit [Clostridia bacterium]|nr:exodeoxyribonuclease VII small subunit [Clostridia bacterium]
MAEKIDFETALKSLEEVVEKLQKGDCTLEESITLFEKGMTNVKDCRNALKEAEIKITQLSEVE